MQRVTSRNYPRRSRLHNGTLEAPDFQRQSRDFAAAVKTAGKPVQVIEAANYHHLEMAKSLGNPYGPNGRAALALMKLAPAWIQCATISGPKSLWVKCEEFAISVCRPVYLPITDIAQRGWNRRKVPEMAVSRRNK